MNRIEVLLATQKPFAQSAIQQMEEALGAANIKLEQLEAYADRKELMERLKNVDALIVRSDIIDKEIIKAGNQLKVIVRAGSGFDNIDIKAAHDAGVIVMNTPGQNANAVAELVFGMLLWGARNGFNGVSGFELKGKTLGIHAFGNVGQNVARIAKGFGMNVLAYDPYTPSVVIYRSGVEPVSCAEELYSKSDIISIHLPYTPLTKKVINRELMQNLPEKAILINTARKEVIHEEDLIAMMKERPQMKYLTDIAPAHPAEFLEMGNRYFATPKKMGAQTLEANSNAAVAAARELINYFESGNVDFKVN
ncbi:MULTISPECIES: NAD(P)-dependent oxidoreductase [Bacteroides]|uniref:NAD(P)-dependent oxidoreductase n=1 Tax=Bacteroides TaxID=816 RepID=UPI001D772647|nr:MULTISPECIES: NAD(P)-dependent oxidoreductase [Bacteroides]HJD91949.1 NAD(P)-binding domain-containing protein [Bacteroides coprosuis]